MSDIKLKWGPRTISVPDGVRAAWGARLIFPDDVVWNRCDCDGEQEEKDALLAWLNGTVGARPWEHARVMAANGLLHAGGSEQVTLYEDDRGVVLASPQRSHGYLYAIAYLKPGADTACKWCGVEHTMVPEGLCDAGRAEWEAAGVIIEEVLGVTER